MNSEQTRDEFCSYQESKSNAVLILVLVLSIIVVKQEDGAHQNNNNEDIGKAPHTSTHARRNAPGIAWTAKDLQNPAK